MNKIIDFLKENWYFVIVIAIIIIFFFKRTKKESLNLSEVYSVDDTAENAENNLGLSNYVFTLAKDFSVNLRRLIVNNCTSFSNWLFSSPETCQYNAGDIVDQLNSVKVYGNKGVEVVSKVYYNLYATTIKRDLNEHLNNDQMFYVTANVINYNLWL